MWMSDLTEAVGEHHTRTRFKEIWAVQVFCINSAKKITPPVLEAGEAINLPPKSTKDERCGLCLTA